MKRLIMEFDKEITIQNNDSMEIFYTVGITEPDGVVSVEVWAYEDGKDRRIKCTFRQE